MGTVQQQVATTTLSDGTQIAYATAGQGPFLVYALGWVSHLELSWALPPERGFYEALAGGRTLLRYDKPAARDILALCYRWISRTCCPGSRPPRW